MPGHKALFPLLLICVACCPSVHAKPRRQIKHSAACETGNLFEQNNSSIIHKMSQFLTNLKAAIVSSNKLRVAQMAHYPLSVGTPKSEFTIQSQKEFIQKYDTIFPAPMKEFLLKQEPRCIGRVGAQGFTVGAGQIWFDEYPDGKVRMFSVNAVVYPGE